MMAHEFKIVGGDTDSIMFCKPDMSLFTKEEQKHLIEEINGLLPQEIKFANDGTFPKVLYLKVKNYAMLTESGKLIVKGSSLKSSTIEPILKVMIGEMINDIIFNDKKELLTIYEKYVKMVDSIVDIKPWSTKKTLSPTTYNSERKNETDIIDALEGSEYKSGDRVYLFSKSEMKPTGENYKVGVRKGTPKMKKVNSWCLVERFEGNYDKEHYYDRVYQIATRFEVVLEKGFFKKYKGEQNG